MQKTNALKLRQSLGAVIRQLRKTGEPILVEKGREPVAVLITIEDFNKRFVDREADEAREALVAKIRSAKIKLPAGVGNSLDLVRGIRS